MDTLPAYSPDQIVANGFELDLPCRVKGLPWLDDLVFLKRLRLIPGKRIVFLASSAGKKIVVKLIKGQRRQMQQCAAEERGIIALEMLGILTQKFHSSYWGKATDIGFIATVYIDEAQDLHSVWLTLANKERVLLLEQLMQIFCKMHDGGVYQEDAHLNNFLWRDNEIFAIDGATVNTEHQGTPLGKSQTLDNLAMLFGQLYPRFDPLIPVALEYYHRHRTGLPDPISLDDLLQRLEKFRNARMATYLKKIYRQSTEHLCLKDWHRFVVYGREHESQMLKDFIANPDSFIDSGEMLKRGNSSTVVKTEINGKSCVIKRYNIKSTLHALKRAFQPSRAWVSWRNAHMLKALGIASPEPILIYETRRGPLRSTAYFISAAVDRSVCLADLIAQGLSKEEGRALIEPLLDGFRRSRITHGDMKATNFFVRDGLVTPIDIDGMQWHQSEHAFATAFAKDKARFDRNWV